MGISIQAYANHRGVSTTAVRKAIETERITPEPDGTLDANKADQQWTENTDPAKELWQDEKETSTQELESPKFILKIMHKRIRLPSCVGNIINPKLAKNSWFSKQQVSH